MSEVVLLFPISWKSEETRERSGDLRVLCHPPTAQLPEVCLLRWLQGETEQHSLSVSQSVGLDQSMCLSYALYLIAYILQVLNFVNFVNLEAYAKFFNKLLKTVSMAY